jgi:SAM-dependent methyltransferase
VAAAAAVPSARPVARITWADTAPLHAQLQAHGIDADAFAPLVDRIHESNLRRVREGDLDHLIFYALQSTRFTGLPPIEPALSAKGFVNSLGERERETFLATSSAPLSRIPDPVRARITALVRALEKPKDDPRLTYFRALVEARFPERAARQTGLLGEYLRAMRFLYEKEFVAQRSPRPADAVAQLYRARGLSTDTAVEAGYLVYIGLGIVRALDPDRRVRRVLIVGPGLDLAPRTGMLETGPPESYQPWAVIDALVSLGLSRADDLEVVGADINPRVVDHLRRAHEHPPALTLVSGIAEENGASFSDDYREYFARLGSALGEVDADGPSAGGRLHKAVRVGAPAARALRAEQLDIVTERLTAAPFDLVVATNILPYFDDVELMLAMSNVARMLAPGGVLLHNEPRPGLLEVAAATGLPLEQSRQAVIATVRGAPSPLVDSVFVHRRTLTLIR